MTGAFDGTGLEANDLWVAQEMVVRRGQRSKRPDFGSEVNKRSRVKDQDQKDANPRDCQTLTPKTLDLILAIPILKSKLQSILPTDLTSCHQGCCPERPSDPCLKKVYTSCFIACIYSFLINAYRFVYMFIVCLLPLQVYKCHEGKACSNLFNAVSPIQTEQQELSRRSKNI